MDSVTTDNIITIIRGLIKDNLKTNGKDIFTYDADNKFNLSEDYVSSTGISVYQNDTLLTEITDWTYNSDTNQITISASLTKNDTIIIAYSFYCKYSDSEIKNYIRANLVRFTQYRYEKHFYMNDDEDIVTYNGENPTVREANIIALVTAIDIDPQNVSTQIVGLFSTSAVENMSKQEQIQDVFNKYLKCYGVIDFLEVSEDSK